MSRSHRNRSRTARASLWRRTYRVRIEAGKESCRHCGVRARRLVVEHLVASAHGQNLRFDNATILCPDCSRAKGANLWGHLVSLAEEEAAAPLARRWAELARRAQDESFRRVSCPVCGEDVKVSGAGLLFWHGPVEDRCSGSQQEVRNEHSGLSA